LSRSPAKPWNLTSNSLWPDASWRVDCFKTNNVSADIQGYQLVELFLAAVAASVAAAIVLVLKFKRSARLRMLEDQLAGWRRGGKYWGIRVAGSKGKVCEASRRLSGHVFPIGSAPQLPLPACDRKHCDCRYLPYPERRRQERRNTGRRSDVRFEDSKPDRRSGDERRGSFRVWNQERRS